MNNTHLNISGYRFVALDQLPELQSHWLLQCQQLGIKGTILLSLEGININLSGTFDAILNFKQLLNQDARLADMRFHQYETAQHSYQRLKVKIKKEIITFRQSLANTERRASSLAPAELKRWLDESRDFTLLDTRNDFEIEFGTFNEAHNLHINNFGELPKAINELDPEKPVVMFCTGGIRCEKAALYMQDNGFKEVYQLDGGILGYFNTVGGEHYQGGCFVFDEREVVTP